MFTENLSPNTHLSSTESFPYISTPKSKTFTSPTTSPFAQFCVSALSPIRPPINDSPATTPVSNHCLSPKPEGPPRVVQIINFSHVASKTRIEASCIPIDVQIVPDLHQLPKVRQRQIIQEKAICCSCQKSKCLKLYCDCFRMGQYCKECSCVDCLNLKEHEALRKSAIASIVNKNPEAFGAKKVTETGKGCNCKKSGCLKRYCECFQAGNVCTDSCKCCGCSNKGVEKKQKRV